MGKEDPRREVSLAQLTVAGNDRKQSADGG